MNIVNYCEFQTDDDLTFDFIISGQSGYQDLLRDRGYTCYVAPPISQYFKYKSFLKALFENNKYDYLWFNNTSKVNILLPYYAKKWGKAKVIAHSHGISIEEKGIKRLLFVLLDKLHEKKMYSLIDIPFSCSSASADYYFRNDNSLRSKAVIISNGIDSTRFAFSPDSRLTVRNELNLSNYDILLGAVGRLTDVKNYSFIIKLLASLNDNYKMIILGEGEKRSELESLITELGLTNRCFLLGSKTNIEDYLCAMDVFLMPSFHEGLPFSLVEAQNSGLLCIVSSNVSSEAKLTDLVEFLSIDSIELWFEKINGINLNYNRDIYKDIIRNEGYSISSTYELFYSELNKVTQ